MGHSAEDTSLSKEHGDPDLAAVRMLIDSHPAPAAEDVGAQGPDQQGAGRFPDLAKADVPSVPHSSDRLRRRAARVRGTVMARVKAYDPDAKTIVWTSVVLMLLLQPVFVLGWSLALIAMVLAVYWLIGGDQFWRRVIRAYELAEPRWPVAARQAKLRGYAAAKKWDRLLSRLPVAVSDRLRVPDLRDVIAADAAHDAVMSDRLTRLERDPVPR